MEYRHKDPWEEEYARERSNSPNGVLVEICLYGQNDRSTWLVSRISESLSRLEGARVKKDGTGGGDGKKDDL